MSSATTTTIDPILKQLYNPSLVGDMTYKSRPFFGLLQKPTNFFGRNMPIPIKYARPMGRSASFTYAQTNAAPSAYEDFLLTRVSDYCIATIDGEASEASESQIGAFVSAAAQEIDGAMESLADAIESFLFGTGAGALATVGSESTTSLTLADINDVTRFEVGMVLVVSATDGAAVRSGTQTISGINRTTGVLTAGTNWTTGISALIAGDYIYVQGDAANAGSNVKISGFQAWCPAATPAATSFFGVNRTVDSRLYGLYHDGTAGTVEEALIDAQSKAGREGASPDVAIINNVQMRRLIKELGSKRDYVQVMAQGAQAKGGAEAPVNVGYRAVVIQGDKDIMHVVSANKAPSAIGLVLESDTWTFPALGMHTKFLMRDGNKILRQASADGDEIRVAFRGNLGCKAPGHNVHVALPAA